MPEKHYVKQKRIKRKTEGFFRLLLVASIIPLLVLLASTLMGISGFDEPTIYHRIAYLAPVIFGAIYVIWAKFSGDTDPPFFL